MIKDRTMAKKKKKQQQQQQPLSPERFLREKVRSLPIGKCYINTGYESADEGYIIVTREHKGGKKTVGCFLVDPMCLGVKDCFCRVRMDEIDFEELMERFEYKGIREISYEEAHNRIWGALAFAEDAGIKPEKGFALAQYVLEEDTEDIPLIEYDYGKDGKHCLIVHSRLEASRYLPTLEKNLGDNFDVMILGFDDDDDFDDDDFDDDDDYDDDDYDYSTEAYNLWKENGENNARWEQPYTYQHPDYPTQLTLENPQLLKMLASDNWLSPKETASILSLPHDSLRRDLEQVIYWSIGQEYATAIEEEDVTDTMINATILIAEVGNEDSLKAMLEVLRQKSEFLDKYYGDTNSFSIVPTLYKLGRGRLDLLMAFMKETGLDIWCKSHVTEAVAAMHRDKETADASEEWFRNFLQDVLDDYPNANYADPTLMGLMTGSIQDMGARELLTLVKRLYDLKFMDKSICGHYSEVEDDFDSYFEQQDFVCDVDGRYAELKRIFG